MMGRAGNGMRIPGRKGEWNRIGLILALVLLGGVIFQVQAAPNSVRASISFEGNEVFTTHQLLHNLERLRVKTQGELTPMDADDAAFFTMEFYKDGGFSEADVGYRYDAATRSGLIEIDEGERLLLGNLSFDGQEILPVNQLRDIAMASLRRSSRRIFGALRYVPSALDQAAEDIRQSYLSRGHLAAVVDWEPLPSTRERHMDANFLINEGALYRLTDVRVEGAADAPLPADFFEPYLGRPYTPDEDMVLRANLLRHFRNHGYFAASVRIEREFMTETGDVSLVFSLDAGPPYRIGDVEITGVQKTNPAALRGLFGWKTGELFDASRQNRALRRIWFTGAFSDVRTKVTPRENGEPLLDVDLLVEEGKARQVRFSLGYNEWEMATGAIEYSDRNFFGSLTRLDVRLHGSQKGYGALALLSDPFLLNTDLTGAVGAFFTRQELPGYEASFAGGVLGVKRIFQEPNQTGYQAQFEYRAVFDTTIFGFSPDVAQELNYTVSALSWNQTLDRRNSQLMPMSGYFLNYEFTLASEAFGGDLNFFQPVGHVSWYFPLREITNERTFVPFLVVNHRSGIILPFGSTGNIPTPERFFLGGPNTIRSFQLDGMAPRDAEGDPVGGEFFWQLNLEAQVPIFGPVYVVGFMDIGNLALTWQDAGLDDTRFAPGIGLRIYTPIGPVYLDYGYNLVRKDGDPIGAVQFGFGFTF